jgi:hypothetical protein
VELFFSGTLTSVEKQISPGSGMVMGSNFNTWYCLEFGLVDDQEMQALPGLIF